MATRVRIRLACLVAVVLVAGCTSQATEHPSASAGPSVVATAGGVADVPAPVVARRDFQISYQLDGASEASPEVPINPPAGVSWLSHDDAGTVVSAGDRVGQWEVDPSFRTALAVSARTSRVDASRLAQLDAGPRPVVAPVAGTVQVSETGRVSIAAPGIDVVVPVTGIQRLRLSSVPITAAASVETVVGQRTIACDFVWIDGTPPAHAEGVDASGALRCRLPRIIETAPGLRATAHVTSKVIKDAIVVPDVMLGQDATGYTVTIIKDGGKVTIPVEVGPSNGVVRVITSDLPVGATIVDPDQ